MSEPPPIRFDDGAAYEGFMGTRAAALKTEVGSALLKIVRLMHGPDTRPVAYLAVYLCPERSRIMMDIKGDELDTLGAGQVVHDFR
jgi:GntR family transcriptional regulator